MKGSKVLLVVVILATIAAIGGLCGPDRHTGASDQ